MKRTSWFSWFVIIMGAGMVAITLADIATATPPSREGARDPQVIELEDVTGILETQLQKILNDRRKRVEVK